MVSRIYDVRAIQTRVEGSNSFLFAQESYHTLMRGSFAFLALLAVSIRCWGQLDLPFVEVEPEATPTPSPEEVAREQERIRELTREMQKRGPSSRIILETPPHPGKEHFAKVYERLLDAPRIIRLKVRLEDGGSVTGQMENRLIDLKTPSGTFPLQWSDVKRLKTAESQRELSLVTGETLRGVLTEEFLQVERDDASFIRIPLRSVEELLLLQNR